MGLAWRLWNLVLCLVGVGLIKLVYEGLICGIVLHRRVRMKLKT